jgi:hypothetical protein
MELQDSIKLNALLPNLMEFICQWQNILVTIHEKLYEIGSRMNPIF